MIQLAFCSPSALLSLLCGTRILRLFRFWCLYNDQLAFLWPPVWLPLLSGTRLPRLFLFWSLFINLLSLAHLRDFFDVYVELASPGCLFFGVYFIIKLLVPAHLRAFTFCIRGTHILRLLRFWSLFTCLSPYLPLFHGTSIHRLFWFRSLFIMIQFAFSRPSAWLPHLYVELASPDPLGFWVYLILNLFSVTSSSTWNSHPPAVWVVEFI